MINKILPLDTPVTGQSYIDENKEMFVYDGKQWVEPALGINTADLSLSIINSSPVSQINQISNIQPGEIKFYYDNSLVSTINCRTGEIRFEGEQHEAAVNTWKALAEAFPYAFSQAPSVERTDTTFDPDAAYERAMRVVE